MSVLNQLLTPLDTLKSANYYHDLCAGGCTVNYLINVYGSKDRLIPLISWNPIWNHRIAIEISAQLNEAPRSNPISKDKIEIYRKSYLRAWSTMPLKSNKSFSYFVGACALDAVTKTYNKKNIETLLDITRKLVGDGCFTEGSHYSLYCSSAYQRAFRLLTNFYNDNECWIEIAQLMIKLQEWQSNISDEDGVVAVIGDSWYEKTNLPDKKDPNGVFRYQDMTIEKKSDWTVISNHRSSRFSLHEHAHADEILVAKNNKWAIKGSGMPSYKQVMAKPWRWRRPRNHFSTESIFDWYIIWRIRKLLNNIQDRKIEINDNDMNIIDQGKKTIRLPIDNLHNWTLTDIYPESVGKDRLRFEHNGFIFQVAGDIKEVRECYAWISDNYKTYNRSRTLRVTGVDMKTTIKSVVG